MGVGRKDGRDVQARVAGVSRVPAGGPATALQYEPARSALGNELSSVEPMKCSTRKGHLGGGGLLLLLLLLPLAGNEHSSP